MVLHIVLNEKKKKNRGIRQCFWICNVSMHLAWRIPGMGEPGGLQSMGLHRVGHD